MPERPGILMSSSTSAGFRSLIKVQASSPSHASITWHSGDSIVVWTRTRSLGSSSTIKTVCRLPVTGVVRLNPPPSICAPVLLGRTIRNSYAGRLGKSPCEIRSPVPCKSMGGRSSSREFAEMATPGASSVDASRSSACGEAHASLRRGPSKFREQPAAIETEIREAKESLSAAPWLSRPAPCQKSSALSGSRL